MADIIRLLPDSVANQIAAGEVVQRPASVVKELIENAVDAGSTIVSVSVKEGGKLLIQVIDNGCGMSETDARLSFERHATSKIQEAGDLFEIQTLGFRGEALASIAGVAHVTLVTRKQESQLGTQVMINGSDFEKQEPVNCPGGTNISVKNLFFNIPARRKFLKSTNVEFRHIIEEFMRVALSHPDIEFKLIHNDSEIYNLPVTNLKQRIVHLFGRNIINNLTPLSTKTSIIEIYGFVGKPELAKKKYGEQYFFINGRYMRHPFFHRAVLNAYEQLLQPDTIPSYFIFFKADPKTIDVNIHPTKTEIKFEDEQAVFQILKAAVREAIGKSNFAPSIDFETERSIDIPLLRKDTEVRIPEIPVDDEFNPFEAGSWSKQPMRNGMYSPKTNNWEKLYDGLRNEKDQSVNGNLPGDPVQMTIDTGDDSQSDSYLQLKNRYVLTQVKSGLMIVDQKRAFERILYEKLIHSLANNVAVAQQTLFPETIQLDPHDYNLVCEIIEDLNSIGFDISNFGNNTVVVNGCPAEIKNPDPRGLIEQVIEEFRSTGNDVKKSIKEAIARSLAKVAGCTYIHKLSASEMRELIDRLFACENPNYSPSGRKIITITGLEEIDKKLL